MLRVVYQRLVQTYQTVKPLVGEQGTEIDSLVLALFTTIYVVFIVTDSVVGEVQERTNSGNEPGYSETIEPILDDSLIAEEVSPISKQPTLARAAKEGR